MVVTTFALQAESQQVQDMIQHIANFTDGQSNPLYGNITSQVNWHYASYLASCDPVYCDITQVSCQRAPFAFLALLSLSLTVQTALLAPKTARCLCFSTGEVCIIAPF